METYKKEIIDSATGQMMPESNETGVIVQTNSITPSAASTSPTNLITISVPAGGVLLISEIDVFASASAVFLAYYSFTVGTQTVASAKTYYLSGAGFLQDVQSLSKPIMTMFNLSTTSQTFIIAVQSTAANTTYGTNVRYTIE